MTVNLFLISLALDVAPVVRRFLTEGAAHALSSIPIRSGRAQVTVNQEAKP